MTLFDFFESVELPVPEITPEQAADPGFDLKALATA